jgi:hypothetical protein
MGALVGAMVVFAVQREARAQVGPVPVVVLSTAAASATEATPRLSRVAAALSSQARVGPALSEELRERYGRRPPSVNTMLDAQARVDAARTAYNNAAAANDSANMNAALDALERVAGELEQQQDILATFPEAREQLSRALLFIANSTIQSSPARADDAIRRLAMVDPQRVLAARAASSAVRQAFAQRVQEMATAGLVVQSVPTGCEVFRDGRSVGNAPAQLSNLSPGSHRISVRCGGRMSLMHPITVASGATATLVIDAQLDAALDLTDTPMLRYPSIEVGRARWVEDLAKLGSALGATRILGLVPSEDRVIAVDVVSATIVGESPVTDGAQLRRLATSEGLQSGARTVTSRGSTTTPLGSSTTSGDSTQDGQSNTVRTPTVGVVSDNVTQRRVEWREETREVRGARSDRRGRRARRALAEQPQPSATTGRIDDRPRLAVAGLHGQRVALQRVVDHLVCRRRDAPRHRNARRDLRSQHHHRQRARSRQRRAFVERPRAGRRRCAVSVAHHPSLVRCATRSFALLWMALTLLCCADPPTQAQLQLEFTGLSAGFNRGSAIGGIELEMIFTPTTPMPSRAQRRISPLGSSDSRAVTVQLPDGRYRLVARIVGRVDCGPMVAPREVQLGTQSVDNISVPPSSSSPVRVAITSTSLPNPLCQ